ncbi:MAG: sigma-70 family RNA polymerase sigma factor [Myxococcales bacterium]|nr:sigma-70 family RNA polymerase sigma factor [Myxococcales bacterium]
MDDDSELLQRWRAGDRGAGNTLFKRHFAGIYRFFRNKVDTHVEDLVQRTFHVCVESRDRFRGEASVRTYLFGIARNVLFEHLRRGRRAGEPLDPEETSIVDLGASPTSLLAARAEEVLLVRALRTIPVAQQVILELVYWEHLTGHELGVFLGVPEDTARSRLRRARRLLEEAMTRLSANPALVSSTLDNLEVWTADVREKMTVAP